MSKKFWSFKNAKEDPKIGELDIYGEIADSSWWGDEVTPKQFKKDMDALGDISELNVYINSPGGDVFAGQTIYSILKRKKCAVNVYIDGLAASAASVIAMIGRVAGNTLNVPKNAMLMIHNPWSLACGYASDMRQMAETLDKIRDSIVAVYKDGSGLEEKDIIELMDAETWMTAQDAFDFGFIDHIDESKEIAASINGKIFNVNGEKFDISKFKNFPINKITKIINGVAPNDVSKKKAPEEEEWVAPTLSDFTDKSWENLTDSEKTNIAGHFAWAAEMPPATYGDLKLPHHNTSGEIVWRGVANAAARLSQSSIPNEDISKVQAHLGAHYKAFDKTPPWEEDEAENKDLKTVTLNIDFKSLDEAKTKIDNLILDLEKAVELKNKLTTEEKPADESGFFDTQLSEKIDQLNLRRNVK